MKYFQLSTVSLCFFILTVFTGFSQNFQSLDQYLQKEVEAKKLVGVHGLVFHKTKLFTINSTECATKKIRSP